MNSLILAAAAAVAIVTFQPTPDVIAKNQVFPPMYLSGVVAYDTTRRFTQLKTGRTRFLSCREALDDTQSALALAAEYAPAGSHSEGICIPLHVYNETDLQK